MARVRPSTVQKLHRPIGDATVQWEPSDMEKSIGQYIVKSGMTHLLHLRQYRSAERRMLDLPFMAHFLKQWATPIHPWNHWRVLGSQKARDGYTSVITALTRECCAPSDLAVVAEEMSKFLPYVGC